MLSERFATTLSNILIPRDRWTPHPKFEDRAGWQPPYPSLVEAHIARGREAAEFDWPVAPATFFLDYQRTGNRSRWQTQVRDKRRQTLADLVVAECLEGQGQFIDPIIDGIWATCEETFWGVPAHLNRQKAGIGLPDVEEPVLDLFAAEAAALLAWTHYLLRERLDTHSRLICDRIRLEIDRRILAPCLEQNHGWMGFNNPGRRVNNWNPWIVSNWLTCALVIEDDTDRRVRHVSRAMEAVDNFIDPYPADGGCDEGPGYWNHAGGALYDCLEIFRSATGGQIDVYDEPLIQEIGRFPYRTQIGGHYFVNFADAAGRISLPPAITYGYGKRIDDEDLMALGAWSAREADLLNEGLSDSLGRQLRTLPLLQEMSESSAATALPLSSWLSEIQVFCARDTKGSTNGYFIAGKGGNNEESHNHNDIGHVIVYIDGRPLIVDIGVEDYTSKTFGPDRYDIWTMNSSHHSLPTINGIQQAPGANHKASSVTFEDAGERVQFKADISDAYPEAAAVDRWTREVVFRRREGIVIHDDFTLTRSESLEVNFMTPSTVQVREGEVHFEAADLGSGEVSASGVLTFDADAFEVHLDDYPLAEISFRRGNPWGQSLTRIRFSAKSVPATGTYVWRITQS